MRKILYLALMLLSPALLSLGGCRPAESDPRALEIVDAAILRHGGDRIPGSTITFTFRGTPYEISYGRGGALFTRHLADSNGSVTEVLRHGDFDRLADGIVVPLTRRDSLVASETLNSVPYFALLPFRLNDPAVVARYLDRVDVAGRSYDKVEVTFRQKGGGRDWEDRFVYWFRTDDHVMDYLSYRYGDALGDTRFRVAYNEREIEGIRFADYRNYVNESRGFDVALYDSVYEHHPELLERVSDVILEDVVVSPSPEVLADR